MIVHTPVCINSKRLHLLPANEKKHLLEVGAEMLRLDNKDPTTCPCRRGYYSFTHLHSEELHYPTPRCHP